MFLYSRWLALPLSTRVKIAKELGISKSGSTHVQDNIVVNDGYDIKTVEAALEAHAGDWDEIVAKAEGREQVAQVPSAWTTSNTSGGDSGPLIITQTSQGTGNNPMPAPAKEDKKKQTRADTKPKKKGK